MKRLNNYGIACYLALSIAVWPGMSARAQSSDSTHRSDTTKRIYNVNYWVTGGIVAAGAAINIFFQKDLAKPNITDAEFNAVNPNNIPAFDRWSLHQDISLVPQYDVYAKIGQFGMAALPLTLLIDGRIRHDWYDIVLMAAEVNMVVLSIYMISPIGPHFQTRYRPLVYYPYADAVKYGINQKDGNNKNSFYSGHVASVTGAAFFMAKVYSDYHPELGNDKYWVYAAAAVPSLAMGYIRLKTLDHFPTDIITGLGIGTVCGILIPELHRISDRDLSMGVYSSPEGTGLTFKWVPEIASAK